MAKLKPVGAGATVEVDMGSGTPDWKEVGCTINMTPPPQQRTNIDATCQQDTSAVTELGIEQTSAAQFVEPLDPDYESALINGLYADKTTRTWRFTFPENENQGTIVIEFPGKVSELVPSTAGGTDMLTRTVTVQRNGDIVYNPT